jgi:K+-dependent Na+/Ca+ exchanger-like protein
MVNIDINWEALDQHWWGYIAEVVLLLQCFVGLAIVCDEYMVPALETLCRRWGIREDVAGATFMAFGSAAPEIIVNAVATIQSMNGAASAADAQTANLGVSAILGSGMIAFSMIPATCAFSSSAPLMLKRRPLLRDEGFYMLSLLTLIYIIYDSVVVFSECVMLVSVYVCYLAVVIFAAPVRQYYRKTKGLEVKRSSFAEKQLSVEDGNFGLQQPLLSAEGEPITAAEEATKGLLEDEEDEEDSALGTALKVFAFPLSCLFKITCPNAEEGARFENLYLFTFTMTFVWVSVFSYVLSSIIERWVAISGVNMAVFGLILVSLGAEIPDTIESVSVAKKGYGSMAVANCQGTQVINIALGLGLPWLLVCSSSTITLSKDLLVAAFIQCGVVGTNISMLLGMAVCRGENKARLDRKKAGFLYALYITAITIFIVLMWRTGKLQQ